MKKLVLFLLLSATNAVYGVEDIKKILAEIDNSAKKYCEGSLDKGEFLKDKITGLIKVAVDAIKPINSPKVDETLADCCKNIIKHVVTIQDNSVFLVYKDLFDDLYTNWAFLFVDAFPTSDPNNKVLQEHARRFCVSLIVNYRIFVRDNTQDQDKPRVEVKSIINSFYQGNLVFSELAFNTISKTADQVYSDVDLVHKEGLPYWNAAIDNVNREVLNQFLLEAYRCLLDKENAQELPQPQEDTPTFLEKFPLQRVMTIGGGSALVLATALCAGTEKGREKSSELAKEHPKKAAGIIATALLAGGAVAYKLLVN